MATSPGNIESQSQDEVGALAVQDLQQQGLGDQEEWEYEYSTTETEVCTAVMRWSDFCAADSLQTYYLTIDLSYPEFKERAAKVNYHSRGGYYRNWLDAEPDTEGVATFTTDRGNLQDDEDNDDEPLPEPEVDDVGAEDADEIDPRLLKSGDTAASHVKKNAMSTGKDNKKATGKDKEQERVKKNGSNEEQTEDIQILELHSHNPIISYRGRIFEGQWAEVIGTEAILANRDEDDEAPLPALRSLPGEVDLLGASASRILTTERRLKPKVPAEDILAPIREEWNIRIPTGKDRTGERAQQTRFLENLMALKKKKGETDHVTVYARDGVGKNFKDNKDPGAKPRRRKTALGVEEQARPAPRRIGRPRGRSRRIDELSTAIEDELSAAEAESLSTPTPRRWEDLTEYRDRGTATIGHSDVDEETDRREMGGVQRRRTDDERQSDIDVDMAD
ncbi:hypothetical protein HJFPF1_03879 [Paramyrothecium foliicola]|nr:hypothetical protein HJFPF1_03879 [Paramyrothecium foliicola]